jgi:hypothetical protein
MVLGQAVASQVPVATLAMFRAVAPAGLAGKAANSIRTRSSDAAARYIDVFLFIVLLGCKRK